MESPQTHDLAALAIHRHDGGNPAGSRVRRITAWVFGVAIVVAASLVGFRELTARRAPLVETTIVRPSMDLADSPLFTAAGYLVADRQAKITPKISGRIVKLNADTGMNVHRGDVLAVLESTSIAAQLDDANARLWQAQREYDRQAALWKDGITSRSAVDAAEAQLRSAKALAAQVHVDLQDMVIRAPFDGTIATKNSEVGEVISSNTLGQVGGTLPAGAICTIVDLKTLKVVVDVNETSLSELREGQPADVTVDAFPGRKWRGVLTQIIPTADRAKGVVQVKVAIIDPAVRMLPEMSASVSFLRTPRLDAQRNEPKIWLPAAAIVRGRVATVDGDQRITWRSISTGAVRDDRVEVRGLRNGERVVIRDAAKLTDGEFVRLNP